MLCLAVFEAINESALIQLVQVAQIGSRDFTAAAPTSLTRRSAGRDRAGTRDTVAFASRKVDSEAIHAPDARVTMVAVANMPPDLILLDWMLPGMTGLELARRLRREKRTAGMPIIMLTDAVRKWTELAVWKSGVDDYMAKPCSTRELVARIRAVLRRSQADDGRVQSR